MTELLTEALRRISEIPEDQQDDVARMIVAVADHARGARYQLTDAQLAEVQLSQQEVREGKIATDDEMADVWRGFGH